MNVIFIQSIIDVQSRLKPLPTTGQMQCGISYISALLKKHGHTPRLIILSRVFGKKNKHTIDRYLKKFYPRVIGFTTISSEYRFISNMASYIKRRYPDIYLVAGGPHASLNPEEIMHDAFDAVCIGEGEYPMLELVAQVKEKRHLSGILNLWIKNGSHIEMNPTRPFLQDLDNLPFPDRDIWSEWTEDLNGQRDVVLAGRGCPFECTYCCNYALRKLSGGSYVRTRSPDNILKEIKDLLLRSPDLKEIFLEIETLGMNMKWAFELCTGLELFNTTLNTPISYGANLRLTPNQNLEGLFARLKKSNFKYINIGLESGSEMVRSKILKRHYSNEDIIKAARLARRYGLKIGIFNMFGVPGETQADFRKTVEVNQICQPDMQYTSIFYPYPGTELYSLCKELGLLKNTLSSGFIEKRNASLDLPGFSKRQILKDYIWFEYDVYKGHKPAYKLFAHVFRATLETKGYLNYLYRKLTRFNFFKWVKLRLNTARKY